MRFRTRRSGDWTKKLVKRGKVLNRSKFASETWFKKRWREERLSDQGDRWNAPVGYFIADLINRKFGFVIEVDGSIHDTLLQRERDAKKDSTLRQMGLQVFRVKAFDEGSFEKLRLEILWLKKQHRLLKK